VFLYLVSPKNNGVKRLLIPYANGKAYRNVGGRDMLSELPIPIVFEIYNFSLFRVYEQILVSIEFLFLSTYQPNHVKVFVHLVVLIHSI